MKITTMILFSMLLIFLGLVWACEVRDETEGDGAIDYREEMRSFIGAIDGYAEARVPGFIVIPQNGQELITEDGEANGPLAATYISVIDGQSREDLFYGYSDDNVPTPPEDRDYVLRFLDRCESAGVEVMVVDYCWTPSFVDDSYAQSSAHGFISTAVDHRDLDNIPAYPMPPYHENALNISTLTEAQNFLYLINPNFPNKQAFLDSVATTNFDLLVLDLFFDGVELTASDLAALHQKANGGTRTVVCYMSIGEAEDYRWYWQEAWATTPPAWLHGENPDWPGNYKIDYWNPEWQSVIVGNDSCYTRRILDAGFGGVYLDLVDAFEYFEGE